MFQLPPTWTYWEGMPQQNQEDHPEPTEKTGRGVYATIQSLASGLDKEEKIILTQELEKEGFQ